MANQKNSSVKNGSAKVKINCRLAKPNNQGTCTHKNGKMCNKPGQDNPCRC